MGVEELVTVDPLMGPLVDKADGTQERFTNLDQCFFAVHGTRDGTSCSKGWQNMNSTEKEVLLIMVAKKNVKLRQWKEGSGGKLSYELPDCVKGWASWNRADKEFEAKKWLATGGAWPKEPEKPIHKHH